MRIAQVCPLIYPSPPPLSGGTERVVADLTDALVSLGHDVTLFAADGSSTCAELVSCGPAVATVEGAPPGYSAAREAILLDRVRQSADGFDVIHCHLEFMHAVALAPWRRKTLTTVHWRVDEADRQAYFRHFRDAPVSSVSVSQATCLPQGCSHVGTVHHGLPSAKYKGGDGRGGYVAFLGRMTDQKGPDRAIKAARKAGLPIRLAGDIDVGNPRYFETVVKPLLGNDAEYVGPIDDLQKQEFLGNAAVFAMPIDWPEPFGLVVIEAMACGTPVVATPFGAAPEILADSGAGLIAPDGAAFADALKKAAALDRAVVRRAFEARFTARRMAQNYAGIYARLAGSGAV